MNNTKFLIYKGCSGLEPTELFQQRLRRFGNTPAGIAKKLCFVIKAIVEINCDEDGHLICSQEDIKSILQNFECDQKMDLVTDLIKAIMKEKH